LQTVSVDLKIWLVDQKPTTIDHMVKLADQYITIRKQTSHSSAEIKDIKKIKFNKETVHKRQSYSKPHETVRRSPLLCKQQFSSDKQKSSGFAPKSVICAYCKK